ncbi:MAG: cytochrome P450 [Planctomycetota bacterium]
MLLKKPQRLNLSDPKYRDDPWHHFGQLRELGPVVRIKFPFMGKVWAATTYEAVNDVLKNWEKFPRDPANAGRNNWVSWQWMIPRSLMAFASNMLGADGTDHRRLRSLVDKAFARRNIDGMAERINEIASDQLDIAQQSMTSDGTIDILDGFARPFPLTVICELLGLPMEDRPKFQQWFAPISKVKNIFGIFRMTSGLKKLSSYLKEQFKLVRDNPREGLITELVHAEEDSERLTEDELLSMIFLLLAAGHETTVHLITNLLHCLLCHPESRSALLSDWTRIDGAIDETLRYASPVQFTKPRFISADMTFHGVELKQKEMIIPIIAAANCDPARFDDPLRFDIERQQNYHMTFGSGPHTCLGMKLARTEAREAMRTLFERWPDLEAAFDLSRPDWSKRIGTRGFNSFLIRTN